MFHSLVNFSRMKVHRTKKRKKFLFFEDYVLFLRKNLFSLKFFPKFKQQLTWIGFFEVVSLLVVYAE